MDKKDGQRDLFTLIIFATLLLIFVLILGNWLFFAVGTILTVIPLAIIYFLRANQIWADVIKQRNMKLIISLITVPILLASIIVIILDFNQRESLTQEWAEQIHENEIMQSLALAESMFFDTNFPNPLEWSLGCKFMDVRHAITQGLKLSEVVFVNSEEEAVGFPNDVLVAWPTEWTDLFLEDLNEWVDPSIIAYSQHNYFGVDFSDLNLELPLTRSFLIDNREVLDEIWNRFGLVGFGNVRTRTLNIMNHHISEIDLIGSWGLTGSIPETREDVYVFNFTFNEDGSGYGDLFPFLIEGEFTWRIIYGRHLQVESEPVGIFTFYDISLSDNAWSTNNFNGEIHTSTWYFKRIH